MNETITKISGVDYRIEGCEFAGRCPIGMSSTALLDWEAQASSLVRLPYICPLCSHSVVLLRQLSDISRLTAIGGRSSYLVYPAEVSRNDLYAAQLIAEFGETILLELASAMIRHSILTNTRLQQGSANEVISAVFRPMPRGFQDGPAVMLNGVFDENGRVIASIFHGFDLAGRLERFTFQRESEGLRFVSSAVVGLS